MMRWGMAGSKIADVFAFVFKGKYNIGSASCASTEHALYWLKKFCKNNKCKNKHNLISLGNKFDMITLMAIKYNVVDLGRIRAKHLQYEKQQRYHEMQDSIYIGELIHLLPLPCQAIFQKLQKIEFNKFETIDKSLIDIWTLRHGYHRVSQIISNNCNSVLLMDFRDDPNVANTIEIARNNDSRNRSGLKKNKLTRKQLFNHLIEQEIATSDYSHTNIDRVLNDLN